MHSMDSVVAFSTRRFSFCSCCDLTDSLKIGVVTDKEYSFYLLPPLLSIASLHASLHAYLPSKCEDTLGTGERWTPVPSLSDLYFWKGPSLLSFRIFLGIDSLFCWNSFAQVKNSWICRAKGTWIFGPKPDTQLPVLYKHPVIVTLSELVSIYPFLSHSFFCLKSPFSLSFPHN